MLKYFIQGSEKVESPVYLPKTPGDDKVANMILYDNYYDAEGYAEEYVNEDYSEDYGVVEDDGVEDEVQTSTTSTTSANINNINNNDNNDNNGNNGNNGKNGIFFIN